MSISKSILPEFDHEMANTRKTLERVPDDKLGWSPHKKSWSMAYLATHIANLPVWTSHTINEDGIDLAPPDGEAPKTPTPVQSQKELLERFDKNIAAARELIAGANDERMLGTWSLLNGGQTVFTMPRVAVLRSFVMNHIIHHRAQLTVYLRLNDVPVPALYGPSADESMM